MKTHHGPARGGLPSKKLVLGAALVTLLGLGSVAGAAKIQDIMRSDQPATSSGTGLAFEGDRLGEEAPSPFIQGARRSTYDPVPVNDARMISFSNGIRFDTREGAPALAPELSLSSYPATRPGYYIVQFEGPVLEEWRASLERAGAAIMSYVPNYAFLVRVDAGRLETVRHLDHVAWTGPYQPAYKLSAQPELEATPGRQDVVVMLFPGESMETVEAAITASGGTIKEQTNDRNLLIRAEMDRASARALASMPEVAWVEPWYPRTPANDRTQWVLQTLVSGNRKVWDNGITGAGQVLNSVDTGVNTAHNMFRDAGIPIGTFGDYPTHRKVIAYHESIAGQGIIFGDAAIFSYHGSHTGCTLIGNDAPFGAALQDGMSKDAKLYFLDAGDDATGNLFIPVALYNMYLDPYNGNGGGAARISSNSWGGAVAGAYDTQAMQVDQFMWDHKDFLLCFSNGNSSTAGSVGSPASAKDCISAGGTGNGLPGAQQIYTGTSRGPAADGRRKPTVCAPATQISASSGAAGYQSLTGTSMSCPGLAGTMLLARQYLMEGRYPGGAIEAPHAFTPTAALLKAMAVNCGQNDVGGFTVPDNNVGWGRPRLDDVLFFTGDTRQTSLVDETGGLITGEYVEYEFWVSDTTQPLRISLVWTDYPGVPATSPELVNNLNLSATGGGFTYLGNVFSGGQSATGGTADNLNVEECVWRTTPAAGLWRVRIDAANVPVGPQPFALVVSGGLGGNAGIVLLDRAQYGSGDVLGIRVEDLNAGATVSVSVKSTSESTPETVVLGQLAGAPGGVYEGSFPTTLFGTSGDAHLSVAHNDTITVTYTDTSPAHTSAAKARVFLNGANITGVGILDVGATSGTIGWLSSAPANSKVYYGTTPALGSSTPLDPSLVGSHSVTINGLANNTTYYYDVESSDHYGTTVRDDNGGAHYKFTTRVRGDVLIVYGDGTFTEQAKYDTAFARTGWTFDEWNQGQALNPPVGGLTSGLRSYRAVWWQVGWEQYPPFTDAARDSITKYDVGSSRISIVSHDVGWDFGDPTAPDYNATRAAWLNNELHEIFVQDPTMWTANRGVAADPISGAYLTNIPYSQFRMGGAGDQITSNPGTGTGAVPWVRQAPIPPVNCAVRWTAAGPSGDPGSAVWGGTATKQVINNYEWSRLNAATPDDTTRAGILDKTLIWLIGRDHPTVTVTAPNGGEVFVTSPVSISWTESFDGAAVGTRKIEYSEDGGQSWTVISAAASASPFSWNITSIPNGNLFRVRVTIVDNGSPTLTGQDISNANFTLNRPGGDTRGPVVVAGTMLTNPNPVKRPGNFILSATIDDSRTGNSNIAGAEWSVGTTPAPAGSGTAMSGAFASPIVAVQDTVNSTSLVAFGYVPLWIRGRDAAGAWGTADSMTVVVTGGATSVEMVGGAARFGLEQNSPNPFNPVTTIKFGIEKTGPVSLVVFDVNGRVVKTLVKDAIAQGQHQVRWDGRDNHNHQVASGVYFYRLESAGRTAEQKMVLMK